MTTIKLIFIGDDFYMASGTAMSPIYTEDGQRYDWGFVQIALREGKEVHIRPANKVEMAFYNAKLAEMKARRVPPGLNPW